MQFRIELNTTSSPEWVATVMNDFPSFLQDHADCERKASAMAMSFIAKCPDRLEIIPELIEIAREELEHFQQVYEIMESKGIPLKEGMSQDMYVKQLIDLCKTDVDGRFMDRLLVASIVESRGAERFRLIYEALEDSDLKKFYHDLWASEAKHGEVFVRMALQYFDEKKVYKRLDEWNKMEGKVLQSLPLKAALH